ncbi:MAG: CDP-diacylglycerol--glycerol-3-phosphate 3-phosphatidyltransferase [Planctomycetota bacterium]
MPIRGQTKEVPLGSFRDVPNAITAARLVATVVCFVLLSLGLPGIALVPFLFAAATDWADGYWARRWGPITKLGRILDPLADKLLICGVFVYLAAMPDSDVAPWMAVVVLSREMLVTTLRSLIEAAGGDFSAKQLGKWKMVAQCVAAVLSLVQVAGLAGTEGPIWLEGNPADWTIVDTTIWIAMALTIASGVEYIVIAWRSIQGADADG